ncbi:MAG: aldo/keto reductase [Gammaproteobacteria bacterium]|nr:aldo/keto reductase [Gammaproteobacteria bacterium]
MIERIAFGATGHESSRIIFGAAALGAMKQARADETLEVLLEYGVNHIDVAASYGDAELRLAPFLQQHRDDFFLATKTGERSADGARVQLHRSLERLGVDHVDLIQLHNLVDAGEQQTVFSEGGALEALVEATQQGLVRFIGVTGHGTWVATRHLESLQRFDFASVLLPYSHPMMSQDLYADDFETLHEYCRTHDVAIQTIKSVARRRWTDEDDEPKFAWYMPLKDVDPIRRAVHYVLARPGLFLNTSSDATILRHILDAASQPIEAPSLKTLEQDVESYGMAPIFVRGETDEVR